MGFAFGAPSDRRKWDSIESVSHCGECGEETGNGLSLTEEHDLEFTCSECGNVLSFRARHVAVPWTCFRRQWERYLFVHIGVVTYATMPKL